MVVAISNCCISADRLDAPALSAEPDQSGDDSSSQYGELALAADPLAADLSVRMEGAAGMADQLAEKGGGTLRMRRYLPGQNHPRHGDAYDIGDLRLTVTAMLVLQAPQAGGETLFPLASPGRLRLVRKVGRLLMGQNTNDEGEPSPTAEHLAVAVRARAKITATRYQKLT